MLRRWVVHTIPRPALPSARKTCLELLGFGYLSFYWVLNEDVLEEEIFQTPMVAGAIPTNSGISHRTNLMVHSQSPPS